MHLQRNTVPGTADYNGLHDGEDSIVEHWYYNTEIVGSIEVVGENLQMPLVGQVDWYDFRGLGDTTRVEAIARALNMPPLALEDALDTHQRPKYEERPDSFLFIVPHLSIDSRGRLVHEQVSVFWTDQFVLTLQEFPTDALHSVRSRISEGLGRVRKRHTTYLAYIIIDAIVDEYSNVMNYIEEQSDQIEEDVFKGKDLQVSKRKIYELKKTVNELRRILIPLREAASKWLKSEHPMREAKVSPFLRDLADNVAREQELSENFVTRASDLYSLYSNELATETNRVVQLLTVVTVIFIPLSFLTGLYGMNFEYIPGLNMRYGFYVLWGVMMFIVLGLLYFFKKRGWLHIQ